MHELDLLTDLGLAIVTATSLGILAKSLRQPLLLAYLAAGIILGPKMGLGLIKSEATIGLISEIGLILLLFIIGLEIDLKKLLSSGRTLIVSGVTQFWLCLAMGLFIFPLLGFSMGQGRFDALYMSVAVALSSTMIVVKLLYDKFELTTLPGRVTLGILVFQDIWAILFLAVQPNLHDPGLGVLLLSFAKGGLLVAASLAASRFVLPKLFASIAKVPELLLVTAVSWCFLVAGAAGEIGLSREMGALVAGISLSTFPYNVDVIAKVVNIRDFFVTLFFVGLGMQIPVPSFMLLILAALTALFLVASRLASLFPVLYALGNGIRASLICPINLAQMSEFSLVIASLGLSMGHLDGQTVGVLTFVFAITSVTSTYMIQYNHELQKKLAAPLTRLGLREIRLAESDDADQAEPRIVFLGFFREASSVYHELSVLAREAGRPEIMAHTMVVDFNPTVIRELNRRGAPCLYGDIANLDTLRHAHLESARVVVSTIPNAVLRGVTNQRLLSSARRLCPEARVVVTANTLSGAEELYRQGADFVFAPRIHSSAELAGIILALHDGADEGLRQREADRLARRDEILG